MSPAPTSETPHVTAADGIVLVTGGEAELIDVRERLEWDRGHSPLATLVPMSELGARLGTIPDDRRLFIVCHSGQRSARVTDALVDAGYDAANVLGGMIAWHAAGGEIVAETGGDPQVD